MNSHLGLLRVACVQLDTEHGNKSGNLRSLKHILAETISQKDERPVDILILPELALTGYVFRDYAHVEPLLESASSPDSIGLAYASELAKTMSSYVVMGFAESAPHQAEDLPFSAKSAATLPHDARPDTVREQGSGLHSFPAYNAAALFGRTGELIHTFRKHFLFDDDKRWASEGPGFEMVNLPGIGNVCIAICMDLNPYEFQTEFKQCELAKFCVEQEVDYLIVPMAWLLPQDEVQMLERFNTAEQPSFPTLNYWAARCQPFFDATAGTLTIRPKYLIAANRTGIEGSSTFAGSSCVLQMKQGESPVLLKALGIREEGVLLVDIPRAEAI